MQATCPNCGEPFDLLEANDGTFFFPRHQDPLLVGNPDNPEGWCGQSFERP